MIPRPQVDALTVHVCARIFQRIAEIGRRQMDAALKNAPDVQAGIADYEAGLQMFTIIGRCETLALPWVKWRDDNPLNEMATEYRNPPLARVVQMPETCYHCGAEITPDSGREVREYGVDSCTGYQDREVLCGRCAGSLASSPFDPNAHEDERIRVMEALYGDEPVS